MAKIIMTVDGSASVRKMVGGTLRQYGYVVVEAVDGRDALRKLYCRKVDMIITELELPKLDGIGLLKRAQALRRIPVVMLTSATQDARRAEGEAAGASGWMVKPCNPEQLISFTRKVVG